YLNFFAAMGPATLLVAEDRDEIAGTMVIVRRQLMVRDSNSNGSQPTRREAHYLCDLKISPTARSSPALFRLLKMAAEVIRPFSSHACYAIVMSGTPADPGVYSGRLGI